MRLDDFEQWIDETILARGLAYFREGRVTDLSHDDGEWIAEVSGSEAYEVVLTLSGDTVVETMCDCPYDGGPYCKHQAAVLYAIRAAMKLPSGSQKAGAVRKGRDLRTLLEPLDKPTLLSLLEELAHQAPGMEETLRLRFAQKEESGAAARRMLQGAARRVRRHGYIEYGDVPVVAEAGHAVFSRVEDLLDAGEVLESATLSIVLLEEMIGILQDCDDSSGRIGGVISRCIRLLGEMAEDMSPDDPSLEALLTLLLDHALSDAYAGWTHWRYALLEACIPLCARPGERKRLEACLAQAMDATPSGRAGEYGREQLQAIEASLIARHDSEEAVVAYQEKRLENSGFREAAIRRALSEGALERAVTLCLDGEAKDAAYPGLVLQWAAYRYEAAERLGDEATQRTLALSFVSQGEMAYYPKLRRLHTESSWPGVYEALLEALQKGYRRETYVELLLREQDMARLLRYCQENPQAIDRLHTHLLPVYPTEVDALFAAYITQAASRASDRNQYHAVCSVIERYRAACGPARGEAIIRALREAYPRRRAFLDELNRIQ